MKILSYNIHKGFSAFNRRNVLDQIKRQVECLAADIVFLQEVCGRQVERGVLEPQFEQLADTLWPHYAYGRNAVYRAGHHGNAVLSRFPIVFEENIDISTNRFEQRGLLHARVELPSDGRCLDLMSLHLNLMESGRRKQIAHLIQRATAHVPENTALVVAGDFNDWRGRACDALWREAGLENPFTTLHRRQPRTFPAVFPVLALDRFYLRGVRASSAEALTAPSWRRLSDHIPIMIEVDL